MSYNVVLLIWWHLMGSSWEQRLRMGMSRIGNYVIRRLVLMLLWLGRYEWKRLMM